MADSPDVRKQIAGTIELLPYITIAGILCVQFPGRNGWNS